MIQRWSPMGLCLGITVLLSGWAAMILPGNLDAGEISTVAGTGHAGNNGDQGPATSVHVVQPFGVEIGPDGMLYITEVGNHRIVRVDRETNRLQTVVGTGKAGYAGDGGSPRQAMLNEPYEVRFAKNGDMYFVEMKNHIVRKVDAKTRTISTVAGSGEPGYSGDGGPATSAKLSRPHSIALDDRGGLYIADIGNHRIRRVDLKTGVITTAAGDGQKILPRNGQRAQGNPIRGPRALYFHQGTLWIALREGHSVWKLDLDDGRLIHIAGTGESGFSGDQGPPLLATFNGPKGIAVGPEGRVYVVDTENQAIRMIDSKRQEITTVAGFGPKGLGNGGDGGLAVRAQLGRPHGICVDSDGVVYIGDTLNHRVRAFKVRRD